MVFWPVPKKGLSQKLLPKWDGPFEIIQRLGPVTYRIKKGNRTFCTHILRMKIYKPYNSNLKIFVLYFCNAFAN